MRYTPTFSYVRRCKRIECRGGYVLIDIPPFHRYPFSNEHRTYLLRSKKYSDDYSMQKGQVIYTHAKGTLQALLENIVSCLLPAVSRITSKNSFRVGIATRIAKAFNVTISFLQREGSYDGKCASVKFINDFCNDQVLKRGSNPLIIRKME